MPKVELTLSIIATTLALASFCASAWRIWRDRPRLTVFVSPMTFTGVPRLGELRMVQFLICNVGYRPIVLTRFAALGEKSSFQMGIDDEPAAIIGQQDQRFPTLLEPGETLKIHPIGIEILARNQTDPEDSKVFYDPWRYFVIADSFNRLHPIEVSDVLFQLHISKIRRERPKGIKGFKTWLSRKRFLRAARRRLVL